MRSLPKNLQDPGPKQLGQIRMGGLVTALLLVLLGVGTFFHFHNQPATNQPAPAGETARNLTESTLALLQNLDSPVEVRFYHLLDPATVGEPLLAFAGRVDQLLSAYEEAAGGKLKVARFNSIADDGNSASADGLRAFNMDKGETCFLGIALVQGAQKEILPQLSPDWEPALEADLTRALDPGDRPQTRPRGRHPGRRRSAARSGPRERSQTPASESGRPVPEEGRQQLRKAALTEFQAAAQEMEIRLNEAQQRVLEAAGKSEAEQKDATADLRRIQAAQAKKLKEIALRAQTLVEVFDRIKKSAGPK